MTYVIVSDKGQVETREGQPTTDDLIKLTGGGVPELVRFPRPDLVAWVDDNWVSKVTTGSAERNLLPSLLWVVISGEQPPAFGGTVVLTGIDEVDGQYVPTGIDETPIEGPQGQTGTLVEAVATTMGEAGEVLALPAGEYLSDDHDMPRQVQDSTRDVFVEIRELPLGSLNGGYVQPSPEVAFFMAMGMPRQVAEQISASAGDNVFSDAGE